MPEQFSLGTYLSSPWIHWGIDEPSERAQLVAGDCDVNIARKSMSGLLITLMKLSLELVMS